MSKPVPVVPGELLDRVECRGSLVKCPPPCARWVPVLFVCEVRDRPGEAVLACDGCLARRRAGGRMPANAGANDG